MRLMLGNKGQPSLLISVHQEKSPTEFEFWVVNGAWEGTYTNGKVTVWQPDHPWTDLSHTEILSDNQDRLRGDYNDVFNNFDNPDYVAPIAPKYQSNIDWGDDDLPF